MADIHNTDEYISNTLENLEELDYSKEEVQAFHDWKEHMEAEGIGNKRIQRYLNSFTTLQPHLDFDLLQPDKQDLKRLIGKLNNNQINGKDYSVWTLREFKKSIRKFYQYHTEEEEPEILDFMTLTVKETDKPMTSPDELPQPRHVKKIVKQLQKPRDQALLFLTWDTGARIGEILNLKWRDVSFTENGAKIKIRESKSMKRQIPVYECVEHLRTWKETTPKDGRKNYVFINNSQRGVNSRHFGKQLGYNSARKVFKKADDILEDPIETNPHAFRKGRATFLASQGWNSAQLCEYFGWNDFATAKTYIRMAKKDLESAMKKLQGIKEEEEDQSEELRPAKCSNCDTVNPGTRDYCKECDQLISEHKELLRESKRNEIKHEVKDDTITTLLQEYGISQEEVEERMREKTRERMKDKGLL